MSIAQQSGTYLDRSYEELATTTTPSVLQDRSDVRLSWSQPESDVIHLRKGVRTLLYHPFWINKSWCENEDANRVLVLDPSWFAQWPVSEKVTDFMVGLARDIDGMQIYVGSINDLVIDSPVYVNHPYTGTWSGGAETMPVLFPEAPDRSFNSFTSFWKAAEKSSSRQTSLL